MKLSNASLSEIATLARATRQIGEREITLPFEDGTVTLVFAPPPAPVPRMEPPHRPALFDGLRRRTLLFSGLRRAAS